MSAYSRAEYWTRDRGAMEREERNGRIFWYLKGIGIMLGIVLRASNNACSGLIMSR